MSSRCYFNQNLLGSMNKAERSWEKSCDLFCFTYNRKGMLANILDTNGRKVRYVYNGELLAEIKDDNGM